MSINKEGDLVNALGLSRKELEVALSALDINPERSKDIFKYIHREFVTEFSLMPSISKLAQQKLSESYFISPSPIAKESFAEDGVIKWLIDVGNGNHIETVYIPEKNRATLCISSQVGCVLDCSFCSTGKQGFNRNLTPSEVIGQVWLAQKRLLELNVDQQKITNVVFMGMGEPLLNTSAVFSTISILNDDFAYGLSRKRVTVSTSGFVPGIDKLANIKGATLAISLHAPTNELRDVLVPINRKYDISTLIKSLKDFLKVRGTKEKFIIEYVMLKGVNDSVECANKLIEVISEIPVKVNLIPFNPFPGTPYECSDDTDISAFWSVLDKKNIVTTIRRSRGEKIAAACGQLAGGVLDRTKRQSRYASRKLNTSVVYLKDNEPAVLSRSV